MEERRQLIVVILVVVFFLIGIAVAYMLSNPSAKKGGGLRADQRFKARPGTTRENAVALVSNKRPAGVDDFSGGGSGPLSTDPVDVRSLSPEAPQEDAPAEDPEQERQIQAALTAQPLESGIKTLQDAIDAAQTSEAQSRLNLALAELHLKRSPPDPEAAATCLEKAFQQAGTPGARNYAALRAAEMLRRAGRVDLALQQLQRAIEAASDTVPVDAAELRLRITYGDLLALEGDSSATEQAYAKAIERSVRGPINLDATTIEALRLAGIRLSQLYRSQQRHADAEAVAQRVQSWLRSAKPVLP